MWLLARFVMLAAGMPLVLTACGAPAGLASASPGGVTPQVAQKKHQQSWMDPRAPKMQLLLYVTNGSNVEVFNYKTSKLVGDLTGFSLASGSCEDSTGNVWISDYTRQTASEYAHGGSVALRVLQTDGQPQGCAIAPASGDLAVMNQTSPGGSTDIEVWPQASGTPTTYSGSDACQFMYQPPAYDGRGNLYVEGSQLSSGGYAVCELPAGGSAISVIPFDEFVSTPGGVAWDGKYMTVVNAGVTDSPHPEAVIYQTRPSGTGLKTVGKTTLGNASVATFVAHPFILGKKNTPANRKQGTVLIANNARAGSYVSLFSWSYPAGAVAMTQFPASFDAYVAASVSIKTDTP